MPPKKEKDIFVPFYEDIKNNNLNLNYNNYEYIKEKDRLEEQTEDTSDDDINNLEIKKYDVDASKIEQSPLMKIGAIPSHPYRVLCSGQSGSGKTMLVVNLIRRFMRNYFDIIFLFSPTASKDNTQSILKISPQNIQSDLDNNAICHLEFILSVQEKEIEKKGISKSDKILIIFDDIIASTKFLNSEIYKKILTQGRHYNISSCTLIQKYNSLPRTLRLQMSDLFVFLGTSSEMDRIAEEYCPPGKNIKDFKKLIDIATNEPYSFLYINVRQPLNKRFRKGLKTYLEFV